MNRSLSIKLLGLCWFAGVLGSEKEEVPVYLFGKNRQGMLYQSYFVQCDPKMTVSALQGKWIAMRKEVDPDYEDYDIKVFVKLPGKKGAKMSDGKEKRVSFLKLSKVNTYWKQVREEAPYLSFIFEEEELKASIKIVDEVGDQKIVYNKVYGFRTKISDIKGDILLERASQKVDAPRLRKDQVVLDYYFIYLNKIFTIRDDFTIGQFVRYFHKDHRSSEFTFCLDLAPVTNDQLPTTQNTEEVADTMPDRGGFLYEGNRDTSSSSKRPATILGVIGLVGGLLYRKRSQKKEEKKLEKGSVSEAY